MLILAAFVISACSTTGLQRSEEVQSSMEKVDNDIKEIVVQLDATGNSLNELTKIGQSDAKQALELYSKNVSMIEEMEDEFNKHAAELKESSDTYFSEWDKNSAQYDNVEIQRSSDERREALGNTFENIANNNVGVKEAFRAYVSDLTEIQQFMSNDLTPRGIDSIASTSDQAVRNGDRLKNELQNLQEAIAEARREMRQNGITMN